MRKWPFLIIAGAMGLVLILLPLLARTQYEAKQLDEIALYEESATETDAFQGMMQEAEAYNKQLYEETTGVVDPFNEVEEKQNAVYTDMLNYENTDVMAYITVANKTLPIYHGTSDETLKKGVGHLVSSSLPVGGENTHTVLAGHSGLTSHSVFDDLHQVKEGDYFTIHVGSQELTYVVKQISVIEPTDLSQLQIQEGKDLCTLMTCTPINLNTHRLLVTGERVILSEAESEEIVSQQPLSLWTTEYLTSILAGVALAGAMILVLHLGKKR